MPKHALIPSGGWPGHEPAATSEIIRADLATAGFEACVATTPDAPIDPALAEVFDLIVPNRTMGELTITQPINPRPALSTFTSE